MAVMEFAGVSKIFTHHAGRMLLRSHLENRLGSKTRKEFFYALKNVSFTVEHGESLAVIGRNGAGKSTLLSVAAGLARPSHGRVEVNGRIAALLELGSGFHPDLTGAENLRLNASLLGLSRKETAEAFDQIVEFAGIGDFINDPLRTYSSGMVMRLAFSVAINTDPDILIVDEVLAVGDQSFQAKSFEKVVELRRAGKTLLCVSHSMPMLRQLCDRALWLDRGEVMLQGPVGEVLAAYEGQSVVKASL